MKHLRKIFFVIIAAAIGVDAIFDFLALRQSYASDVAKSEALTQVLIISAIDLLLMVAATSLWILSDRANRKNEILLRETISRSELANRELQQIIALRSSRLRNTVHDLKNPLGSIRGFSDLIEEDHNNPTSVVELSQSVKRLSEHTLSLVNSILELETADGSNHESRAKVDQVLKSVCDSLAPQLLKKNQLLKFDVKLEVSEVQCDPEKLWDVFTNLVGNAVKFSPINGKIEIRAKAIGRSLVVEIEDNGPGFSADDISKAFIQSGSLSAKPTGDEVSTGLGLLSAYNFIHEVGGSMKITNAEAGGGARLIVELPIAILI